MTATAYRAQAGLRVAVVEGRERIGGGATLEEPWPGYRVSPSAYVVGLLHELVVADLDLYDRGLRVSFADPHLYVPLADGLALVEWDDRQRTVDELEV